LIGNPLFEEERAELRMKEILAWMRDDNNAHIEKIRDLNEDEIEKVWEKLHENYLKEALKIHNSIPDINSAEVVEQRQNLDELREKLANCQDSIEWQWLRE